MTNASDWGPEKVYFIDSRIRETKTFVESGFILYEDEERGTFTVVVYHDDYRSYSRSDFGKTIFHTHEEAAEVVRSLPVVGQTVYYVKSNRVFEDEVEYFDVPAINLKSGEYFSMTEVGKSLFLSKEDAQATIV